MLTSAPVYETKYMNKASSMFLLFHIFSKLQILSMDNLKVADVIKRFCIWILDTIFLHEELPVLEIPKLSSGMANLSIDNVTTKRKLHCAESARQYAEILAVAAVIVETVLSNKFMSQRDVYYSLKHQFSTQAVCNTRIIELGLLWRLKRCKV
mgnify:CR=1 FL=1